MSDKQLNTENIRDFYESIPTVWPKDDMWHLYSRKIIHNFIHRQKYIHESKILNAGSGGSDYGISNEMHHVDIAKNKIEHFPNFTVSTIESLPFNSSTFTDIICVGSVLNYTDAVASIHELSRVLATGGTLILEFESSWGLEHLNTTAHKKSAEIVSIPYCGEDHNQWIYSPSYIQNILNSANLKVIGQHRFHYLSGLSYNKNKDENRASLLAKYDFLFRRIPIINKFSNNVIFKCIKS